jgi:hypothetical protein
VFVFCAETVAASAATSDVVKNSLFIIAETPFSKSEGARADGWPRAAGQNKLHRAK